ncbi:MAG: diguanylate cyclase domain-containing protein [Syntrophothermus sp.]
MAASTGLLISISMPLTYLVMSWNSEQKEAIAYSQKLASDLQESIKESPRFWRFNVEKFARVFIAFQVDGLSSVKIYDERSTLIHEEKISPSFLEISGRSKIVYNNQVYGYVEVSERSEGLIYSFAGLSAAFLALGLFVGIVLYRFPTRIVRQAENEITLAFQKLDHLSHYDMLTNLPNRRHLNNLLAQALDRASQHQQQIAVMFFDLDRFKEINDTLGHNNGDIVLQMVAERLKSCMRNDDIVARLGGDEFIAVIPDITDAQNAAMLAQRVIDTLAQPFVLEGQELFITSSIGISIYPSDGDDIETLIKNADMAMYRAKEQGKNRYHFYAPAMNERLLSQGKRPETGQSKIRRIY